MISDYIIIYTTATRPLNTCPLHYSCGTADPYWSDDVPLTAAGVPATITAYTSYAPHSSCKYDPTPTTENFK